MINPMRSIAFVTSFTILAACSSSSEESAQQSAPDASVQETGQSDAGSDATSDEAVPEAGIGDEGAAEGGCADYRGAYVTTGTCNSAAVVMPEVVCVRQQGCDATVYAPGGQVFTGEATAGGFQVQTKTPVDQTCTGTVSADALSITCKADSLPIECSGTGQKAELTETTGACCDVRQQDCGDSSRCTLIGVDPTKGPWITACVAIGTGKDGDACTRTAPGRDDCGTGLYCTLMGTADGSTKCRPMCVTNADCGATGGCVSLGSTPTSGACMSTCTFFPDSCDSGLACTVVSSLDANGATPLNSFCFKRGQKKAGESCSTADDCEAGTKCEGSPSKCVSICDDAHPCATGTCKMVTGLASGAVVGVCQ